MVKGKDEEKAEEENSREVMMKKQSKGSRKDGSLGMKRGYRIPKKGERK